MGNERKKGLGLDPRTKLFLILVCILASMYAPSLTYQLGLVFLIAVLETICGRWKSAVKSVLFYTAVYWITLWHRGYHRKYADHAHSLSRTFS